MPQGIQPPSGNVDGLQAAPQAQAPAQTVKPVSPQPQANLGHTKNMVLVGFGALYTLYVFLCLFFIALLPSIDPTLSALAPIGIAVSGVGILVFLGVGAFLLQRIMRSDVSVRTRQWSLMKVVAVTVPGLLLSIATPLMIVREPRLPIDITDPIAAEDFVAPLAVTFSAERASQILQSMNLRALKYQWDTNGDGKVDEENVTGTTTALFPRQGIYMITLVITLDGGAQRKLTRRLVISQAVFEVNPAKPIVERPVRFSIAQLLPDPKQLKQVVWDFSTDPGDEQTLAVPDVVHTYYVTGRYAVTATVTLINNTQVVYKRNIVVENPPPLPFPVTLESDPKQLVGPAPFGAIFRVVTNEPLKEIAWSFGDEDEQHGSDLKRVAKSFDSTGIYPVTVRVRSASGKLAELTAIVRVTETLQLQDLVFEGEPVVAAGVNIRGSAPLTVHLTPKTTVPLIDFSWDDPEGDAVVQESTISKVFRREGSYSLTLIAQNPEGKVMRRILNIQVDPPSVQPDIQMKPETGSAPLNVVFDASQTFIPQGQQIAGFEWLFGDEAGQAQPLQGAAREEHTYKTAGEFTVTLRVVMADGKDYKVQKTLVVRRPTLVACISASRTTVQMGKGVAFDASCSTGTPTNIQWDVRSQSNPSVPLQQSPESQYVHIFDTPGAYNVSLSISDQFGNQDTKSIVITVTP